MLNLKIKHNIEDVIRIRKILAETIFEMNSSFMIIKTVLTVFVHKILSEMTVKFSMAFKFKWQF